VKTVRDRPTVTRAYRKSPPGYSGDPSPTPYDHPFPQTRGSQPPVKTCITNCCQTVPNKMVVSINNLWEHIIAILNSTIVNPLGAPLLKKEVAKNAVHRPCCMGFPTFLYYWLLPMLSSLTTTSVMVSGYHMAW